jgi:hypothetical protein
MEGGYDPVRSGALTSLAYGYECRVLHAPSATDRVGVGLLVEQGYTYYLAGYAGVVQDGWTQYRSRLTASDFTRVVGDGPDHPDFSALGRPLEFGYLTANSGSGANKVLTWGIANFALTVNGTTYADDSFREAEWKHWTLWSDDLGGSHISDQVAVAVADAPTWISPTFAVTLTSAGGCYFAPGSTIQLTAQGLGGTGAYEYRFWMRPEQGVWTTVQDYSANPTWLWSTAGSGPGAYYVQVDVRTAGSSVERDAATTLRELIAPLTPSTGVALQTSPAERVVPGTVVEFTAQGQGGSDLYEYRFWLRSDHGPWSVVRDYATDSVWNWHTSGLQEDRYYVQVDVRTAGSSVERDATAEVSHVVTGALAASGVSLESDQPQRVTAGTRVTFTAHGYGGDGNYEYRYWQRSVNNAGRVVRDYSTDPHWTWDTQAAADGTYCTQADIRTAGSSVDRDAATDLPQEVTRIAAATGVELTVDVTGFALPGTTVEVLARGKGGTGNYEYRFWLRSATSEWSLTRDYSTDPVWCWDTTGADSSRYEIAAEVRTTGTLFTRDAIATTRVALTAPASHVVLVSSQEGRVTPGTTISFVAEGHDGAGDYEYRFWLRSSAGDWLEVRPYSHERTWRWDTTDAALDAYSIRVDVRSVGSPVDRESSATAAVLVREDETQLWNRLIRPYLADDLWTNRDAYDATTYLMVPLQAAFTYGPESWRQDFADHFQRLMDSRGISMLEGDLNRTQYLYLASRFVSLAQSSGRADLIPAGLVQLLYGEIERLWIHDPVTRYPNGMRKVFSGGLRELIDWTLSPASEGTGPTRAIDDVELFVMGIASDLRAYERSFGGPLRQSDVIGDLLEVTYRVFRQLVGYTEGGGWLLQPGVWASHDDYLYAGHSRVAPHLSPSPVPGIAADSSHSHRLPVLLTSFSDAYAVTSLRHVFFDSLRQGLEIQFFDEVLVPPSSEFPAYRASNYMDGRNGVYRYGYTTTGGSGGYGPYELSGTLAMGWWSFLGTDRIRHTYQDLAARYPLPSVVLDVYVGPNTTRARHELVRLPDAFENGFAELLASLASHTSV